MSRLRICKCCSSTFIAIRKNNIYCSSVICRRASSIASKKRWKLIHRERYLHKSKESYSRHKTQRCNYAKQYRAKHYKYIKEYSIAHPRKAYKRAWASKQRLNSMSFVLLHAIRTRIWQALKRTKKSKTTTYLLGCSIDYFKKYLALRFTPGMSWANYGKWHIDHIRPCASFDLSKPKEQRKCFHYTNLQPLWAKDNLKKGARCIN